MATVSIEVKPDDMAAAGKIADARGLSKNEALARIFHTGAGRELALIKYGKPAKPGKKAAKATAKPMKAKAAAPKKAAAKAPSKPSKPAKAAPSKAAPAIIDDLN